MLGSLYIASQALGVGSIASNVTANNIANANTPSYKSCLISFADTLNGGVNVSGITVDKSPGSLIRTGSETDLALYDRYSGSDRSFRLNMEQLTEPIDMANLSIDKNGFLYSNGAPIGQVNSFGGNTYPIQTGEDALQGYLVSSNVNFAKEMIDNVMNFSYFKANANVIRTTDEMVGTLLSIIA